MSQAGIIRLPFTDSSTTKVDFNLIGWIKNNFVAITSTTNNTDVDEIISQLLSNQSFIDYVEETNKIILQDSSKYEDISKKYR